mgnify:CR=1 FL=1
MVSGMGWTLEFYALRCGVFIEHGGGNNSDALVENWLKI